MDVHDATESNLAAAAPACYEFLYCIEIEIEIEIECNCRAGVSGACNTGPVSDVRPDEGAILEVLTISPSFSSPSKAGAQKTARLPYVYSPVSTVFGLLTSEGMGTGIEPDGLPRS